ncbi:MAG: hypothetical protein WEC75_12020 [Dehalococcoidia bacterium]
MPIPRFFILPVVLLGLTALYVAANPSGAHVEGTPTATATRTLLPTATPTATVTPYAPSDLPDGLSGRLTYRTGRELVTVEFADDAATERSRETPLSSQPGMISADGAWSFNAICADQCGAIEFVAAAGERHTARLDGGYMDARWSPDGHTLALLTQSPGGELPRSLIIVVEDPAAPAPRVVIDSLMGLYTAIAWSGDQIVAAIEGDTATQLQLISLNGSIRPVGDVTSRISYFHPAPDGRTFAFTQTSMQGWRLMSVDVWAEQVRDHGNMGSDPAGVAPPISTPPDGGKGPMYIAWSPDSSKLAFGGGFEPPYTMNTVNLLTGSVARSEFAEGYPGEIEWTRDSDRIAVSTYDVERTHHETYVVDPDTGAARFLVSGCVLEWSPDGRFLAVHEEGDPGIVIVDVDAGARGKLTHVSSDVPVVWEP